MFTLYLKFTPQKLHWNPFKSHIRMKKCVGPRKLTFTTVFISYLILLYHIIFYGSLKHVAHEGNMLILINFKFVLLVM